MPILSSLEAIARLYDAHGSLGYGEDVTQLEHALQCAALAEAQNAPPALIVAALLHDLGHLFEAEAAVTGAVIDHRHQDTGAQALAGLFGPAVWTPIALHVCAKRYLCFTDVSYCQQLSQASRKSLALQGGAFDAAQAQAFEQLPYRREAVMLRRFDDEGKRAEISRRHFADYLPLMRGLQASPA